MSAEKIMYVIAAFITFFIIGVWHGVGWNYLIVGFLFGFYVSFDMLTKNFRKKINSSMGLLRYPVFFRNLQILTTFLLVSFVWVFFRSESIPDAWLLIRNMFHGWSITEIERYYTFYSKTGLNGTQVVAGFAFTMIFIFWDILSEKKDMFERIRQKPVMVRWSFYYLLVISIILFSSTESRQFIYLQF